jgi:hypothetical protein
VLSGLALVRAQSTPGAGVGGARDSFKLAGRPLHGRTLCGEPRSDGRLVTLGDAGLAVTRRQRQRKTLWREIRRIAEDDLRAVADALAELEGSRENDAYYQAVALHHSAEEQLAVAKTLADLRVVAGLAARARGALAGDQEAPPCFFDPAHGPSARAVLFAPDGGTMQQVRACGACAAEVDAGRAPALRRVIVAGRPQPYWRSSIHGGYFGHRGDTIEDLIVMTAADGGDALGLFDWLDDLLELVDDPR